MRYFLELAYNGTRFNGWQRQPNDPSVQQRIEDAFRLILQQPTLEIVGCGRTDAGVHAGKYVAHFDFDGVFPKEFLNRANKLVGGDIALQRVAPVSDEAHARFDAVLRSYRYNILFKKNPFSQETAWFFPLRTPLDFGKMQKAAEILLRQSRNPDSSGRGHSEFAPFCKTHSDAKTMRCDVSKAEWIFDDDGATFEISANRFLRGMVRLMVGACVNIGLGQLTLDDLAHALDAQTPLQKSYSVPPTGLFLTEVRYPFAF